MKNLGIDNPKSKVLSSSTPHPTQNCSSWRKPLTIKPYKWLRIISSRYLLKHSKDPELMDLFLSTTSLDPFLFLLVFLQVDTVVKWLVEANSVQFKSALSEAIWLIVDLQELFFTTLMHLFARCQYMLSTVLLNTISNFNTNCNILQRMC